MNGIDVSHNNGTINWAAVATNATPVDFAYIKASEGVGYTDPTFKFNSEGAKKAGIKIGYYHFASLNTMNDVPDAKAEADYFMSIIKTAPAVDLPYILDIETNKVGLDPAHVLEWINTFFAEMKAGGYSDTALYSYTPFLDANLPANHNLGNVRLWIAAYVSAPAPKLPVGWKEYYIWQKSAKGVISGITGNVDLNVTQQAIV
ncbi:MAG: glycoside hydrolase family 25 [Bacteroidetes bacterium]|nr:glycoside hydrolase family 25 [Bacteroidota bacterium]